MATESDKPKPRAVSYCRTSGEGQRDNTSIPRQRADIERFIASQEWRFVRHYVDESLTGSKVEGREAFQAMMKHAANGQFDVIVPWDVTRFSRDGCDVVANAKFLKTNFGVNVVDAKGQFDTRDHRRTVTNFVMAGIAQDERLRIMERTVGGRVQRAKEGLPWCPNLPAGRGFERTGRHSGEWFVNERGGRLRGLLERYADGEPLQALVQEFGFSSPQTIVRIVHGSQLSGTYEAEFNAPDININNLRIPVPAVPEVISPELEQRVLDRLAHNRICNKQAKRKYLLSGFVRCSRCGRSLTAGHSGKHGSYAHYTNQTHRAKDRDCPFFGIRSDFLEESVLDYLFGFFLDGPAYDQAVRAALPSDDDREALQRDVQAAERRLAATDREVGNLVNAIAAGADVGLLLDRQNQLKAEKQALATRLDELTETLAAMPSRERLETEAMWLRLRLVQEHTGEDWRRLPHEDVRRFLHSLFGGNPAKAGNGIFVDCGEDAWHVTFKGGVEFHHDVIDGRATSHACQTEAQTENEKLRTALREAVSQYERVMKEPGRSVGVVKPLKDD